MKSGEYAVPSGSAQKFDKGRIFYSRATGARELFGTVLAGYRDAGGPVRDARPAGHRRAVTRRRACGRSSSAAWSTATRAPARSALAGRIAERYLAEGGLESGLGWPVRGNHVVSRGEQADFEHGSITWFADTKTMKVRITS